MKVTTRYGDTYEIEVGTWVRFKSDIEQSAQVVKIDGHFLTLKAPEDGFKGAYIGRSDFTEITTDDIF